MANNVLEGKVFFACAWNMFVSLPIESAPEIRVSASVVSSLKQ